MGVPVTKTGRGDGRGGGVVCQARRGQWPVVRLLLQRGREEVQQVRGRQRHHAKVRGRQVTRMAVRPHAEARCGKWRQALANQGGNQPSQHVARPAGRHAGVARVVDVDALAVRDDRFGALERDDQLLPCAAPPAPGGIDGGGLPVDLNLLDGLVRQAGQLAGVWRED